MSIFSWVWRLRLTIRSVRFSPGSLCTSTWFIFIALWILIRCPSAAILLLVGVSFLCMHLCVHRWELPQVSTQESSLWDTGCEHVPQQQGPLIFVKYVGSTSLPTLVCAISRSPLHHTVVLLCLSLWLTLSTFLVCDYLGALVVNSLFKHLTHFSVGLSDFLSLM